MPVAKIEGSQPFFFSAKDNVPSMVLCGIKRARPSNLVLFLFMAQEVIMKAQRDTVFSMDRSGRFPWHQLAPGISGNLGRPRGGAASLENPSHRSRRAQVGMLGFSREVSEEQRGGTGLGKDTFFPPLGLSVRNHPGAVDSSLGKPGGEAGREQDGALRQLSPGAACLRARGSACISAARAGAGAARDVSCLPRRIPPPAARGPARVGAGAFGFRG